MYDVDAVRQQVLRQFPRQGAERDSSDELADALYVMLHSMSELHVTVDGWDVFRVVHESENSLDVVGLMTLLPSGSVPIALSFSSIDRGLAWSIQVASQDDRWLSLSESKHWKSMYLFATGELKEPPWRWDKRYDGQLSRSDA